MSYKCMSARCAAREDLRRLDSGVEGNRVFLAYTPSARFFAFLAPTGSVLRVSWFPYHVRASVVLPRPVALDGSLFIARTRLNLSSQHAVSTARRYTYESEI